MKSEIPRIANRGVEHGLRSGRTLTAMDGEWLASQSKLFAGFDPVGQARKTLLAMRREHKLSRGHLAGILGISTATLRRWEDGKRNPSRAARRLLWFISRWLNGNLPRDLGEMITWGRISLS